MNLKISRYTVDLDKLGSVRCSPLINPFLLSYSGKHGISYRQEFKYNRIFTGDRLLRIVPRIGYNFKEKEFYWRVRSDFDYWPRKRAALHLEFGNGNRIYSSDVLDDLKAIPDSIFDFNQIHLDYFKDLYLNLLSLYVKSSNIASKLYLPFTPPNFPTTCIFVLSK